MSQEKIAVIDSSTCIYCRLCVDECLKLWENSKDKNIFNAIEITGTDISSRVKQDATYKGVWCLADYVHGKLSTTIYELLYIGRKLSEDLTEPLSCVLIGKDVRNLSKEMIEHGADVVHVIDNPLFENFLDETYALALAQIVQKEKPNKFIFAASTIGRSIAARLAVILNTGLTADVTEIHIEKETGLMHVTRPTFGGNLMATIVCRNKRPEMTTLRPLTYPKAQRITTRTGKIIEFQADFEKIHPRAKFISYVPEEAEEKDITVAEVIVSGGRGIKGTEGFKNINKLAKLLNGSVGASRAAVDLGWIKYRHQVGLTGKTVKPVLYIACGISGQVQHLAGMSSSDIIVAINKDPNAPMMNLADYSIEDDVFEILPALIQEIKKMGT
jgi:electron transfer flavoprotein alpha subunit